MEDGRRKHGRRCTESICSELCRTFYGTYSQHTSEPRISRYTLGYGYRPGYGYGYGYPDIALAASTGPVALIDTEGLATMAKWTIKLQLDDLFELSVRECIRIDAGNACAELLAEVIDYDFGKSATVPDWDNRCVFF
jgi:hypothetical protein